MFNTYGFISQLLKFSPRQLENETKAGQSLVALIQQNKISLRRKNSLLLIRSSTNPNS